jgi:hypothetical protein
MQEGAVNKEREDLVEGVRECYLTWGEMFRGLSVCHM